MRITEKALQAKIDHLNKITGNPPHPFSCDGDMVKSNIGNYYLNGVYSGWNLVQIMNECGGVQTILFGRTKGELYYQLNALIAGIAIGKELHP